MNTPNFNNVVEADFNTAPEPKKRLQRTEHICQTLRHMMQTGQRNPGDKLPTEEKLCAHFGVSRTTLREAIQMLRVSGLLSVAPGRGSYVQAPSLSRLLEDFALYAHFNTPNALHIQHVMALNLHAYMPKICNAPLTERRKLFEHLINRHDLPEQAQAREGQWLITIASLSSNTLISMLAEWLTSLQQQTRIGAMQDADEILRTTQAQIRLNTAILDGDIPSAQTHLLSYLRVTNVPDVSSLTG